MPRNYYNEIDEKAAAWLEELIRAGEIPPGDVDRRDIRDVTPADLDGYTQCHFFAGIGGWPLALRIAGWPEDRAVWTGSCPCQPFSAAGRRGGTDDERHLWPHWFHLIEICRPPSVFGEQVASKDGLGWLDLVSVDLEGADYAIGTSDLCAAGIGAPHIRQRLYFGAHDLRLAASALGDAAGARPFSSAFGRVCRSQEGAGPWDAEPQRSGDAGDLGDSLSPRLEGHSGDVHGARGRALAARSVAQAGAVVPLANGDSDGCAQGREIRSVRAEHDAEHGNATCDVADTEHGTAERHGYEVGSATSGMQSASRQQRLRSDAGDGQPVSRIERPGPTNGFWRNADWLLCRDDAWRPVESGTFPLAHGVSGRVGLLRGYGNAIVPELAATFIRGFEEARDETHREVGVLVDIQPARTEPARSLSRLLG